MLKEKSVLTIKQEEKYQSLNNKSINANKPSSHKKPNKIPENKPKKKPKLNISKTKARKIRRTKQKSERDKKIRQKNEQYIQNMSNEKLSNEEISLLAKGLKLVPTPQTSKKRILRKQIMQDFNNFARRMRIRYIFANEKKKQHPYHVKSNWEPPITQSVALERFLDQVKLELSEAKFVKPNDNLTKGERKALKKLKTNIKINLKKADKGTTTVIMNKEDKIKEGQIQLDNTDHYKFIDHPMVVETATKVQKVVEEMYKNMASSNTKPTAHTRVLHSDKNTQT